MLEKANYCHEINYFLGGLKKLFCKLTSIIICVCVCVCVYIRDRNIRDAGRTHHSLLRLKLASEAWHTA